MLRKWFGGSAPKSRDLAVRPQLETLEKREVLDSGVGAAFTTFFALPAINSANLLSQANSQLQNDQIKFNKDEATSGVPNATLQADQKNLQNDITSIQNLSTSFQQQAQTFYSLFSLAAQLATTQQDVTYLTVDAMLINTSQAMNAFALFNAQNATFTAYETLTPNSNHP